MSKPILSICIPTYNRAALLKAMLASLAPQVKALNGDVELVVSDNCSPDHTREVVEWARQFGPIRYHRAGENRGFYRNMILLTDELAAGEFCWFLGDDDMVVRGKLSKIVDILKAHSDLDYFFVNYFFKSIDDRNHFIRERDSVYIPDVSECYCQDFSEHRAARWEELLDTDSVNPPTMFGALISNIFRRSIWSARTGLLRLDETRQYSRFDTTFPHITILAHAMVGKPAYYIGDPCVLLSQGSQEWIGYWPIITLVRLNEALELYARLGVNPRHIGRLRKHLLRQSGQYIADVLFASDVPGRDDFCLRRFLWRNIGYPGELVKILDRIARGWISLRLPKPIYRSLRFARRKAVKSLIHG